MKTLLDEQLSETFAADTGLDQFPWWRALSTQEIAHLVPAPTAEHPRGARANPGSSKEILLQASQTARLWSQTKVWLEGIGEISKILGIEPEQFRRSLMFSEAATVNDPPAELPDWEIARRRWVQRSSRHPGSAEIPFQGLMEGAAGELAELLEVVIPAAPQDKGGLIRAAAVTLLANPPVDDLQETTTRSLIQELHNQHETGGSAGSFHELISREGFEKHLSWTYPVLTRIVVTRLLFWQARSIDFISHLADDRGDLELSGFLDFSTTAPEIPQENVIEGISAGAGDSHLGGRSVIVLRTAYGVLVYKPRGGQNEVSLENLRNRLFGTSHASGFHVPRVIDRGDRSWHEFIDSRALSADEAPTAARSLGALTAVVHLLGGNDFHHENVLFKDGRACPVDLETIIRVDARQATQPLDENADAAFRALMDSVAVAGIVPGKIISRTPDGDIGATDVSVVGYFAGQQTPMVVPTIGTDEDGLPRIVEALTEDDSGSGEPLLKLHGEDFLSGFLETMFLCRAHITLSSGPDNLISCFDQARLRYIPRPTMIYAKLLSESYHPFFLRTGTARDVVLAKAWNAYATSPNRTDILRVEYDSLLAGDIPHISCSLDERSPWDARTPAAPTVRERLKERLVQVVEPSNVEYQRRIIEQSFASIGAPIRAVRALLPTDADTHPGSPGSEVMKRALLGFREMEGTLAATTLIAASAAHWTVAPVGFEVYNGRAGILLANEVFRTRGSDEPGSHDLLIRSIEPMGAIIRAGLEGDEAALRAMDVGAASSLAGWGTCLANVPGLRARLDAKSAASDLVRLLTSLIDQDDTFDVMSGSAGAIATALQLRDLVPEAHIAELIGKASDHLAEHAEPAGPGLGWRDPETGQLLGGFSHGAAGIGTYLLAGAAETGDARARRLGQAAFAYDDSLFDRDSLNWPDLRDGEDARSSMKAWCHGSPGALLSRALSWASFEEDYKQSFGGLFDPVSDAILDDIEASLLSADADLLGDCLCHGRTGNLVILKMLAEAGFLGRAEHLRIDRVIPAAIDSIRSRGPRPGGLPGAPSPDLFMGLSGIAWGINRLTRDPGALTWDALSFGLRLQRKDEGPAR